MYTTSMTQQINMGKSLTLTDATFRNQALVDLGGDYMILNTTSALSKYASLIKKCTGKYTISGEEALRYQYRPTYLSYSLYKTIELAPFILEINHMVSASEFCHFERGIYLFSGEIVDVLNQILNKEEYTIQLNRDEVEAELAKL